MGHAARAVQVFCLAALFMCVIAYRDGDTISTLKRSQFKGYRTDWSELLLGDAPRFNRDTVVHMRSVDSASALLKDMSAEDEYKVSFSFDHDRFLTTWITVNDGKGNFLKHLMVTFTHSGDRIVSFKYHPVYSREFKDDVNQHEIAIQYHWNHYNPTNATFGIDFLLVVGTVVAWLCGLLVMFGADSRTRPSFKAE